jgi:hypothetical protein
MTAFVTWSIHFDIFLYVYDVIFFLIGSSSMEKHSIINVVTVCQWFIDKWGYRKQDKWVLSMFDVCYPFPGTHTTSALFSELYLQQGSKSSIGNMWQRYQKKGYILVSDNDSIYNTNVSSHCNLQVTVTVEWNVTVEHVLPPKNAMPRMELDPGTSRIVRHRSTNWTVSRGGYEPTTVPITLGRGAFPLQKQTCILSIIYHTYLLIDRNKRDHQKPL